MNPVVLMKNKDYLPHNMEKTNYVTVKGVINVTHSINQKHPSENTNNTKPNTPEHSVSFQEKKQKDNLERSNGGSALFNIGMTIDSKNNLGSNFWGYFK